MTASATRIVTIRFDEPVNIGSRVPTGRRKHAPIVGHKRSTLTGATYSGKSTLEMWKDALALLSY